MCMKLSIRGTGNDDILLLVVLMMLRCAARIHHPSIIAGVMVRHEGIR